MANLSAITTSCNDCIFQPKFSGYFMQLPFFEKSDFKILFKFSKFKFLSTIEEIDEIINSLKDGSISKDAMTMIEMNEHNALFYKYSLSNGFNLNSFLRDLTRTQKSDSAVSVDEFLKNRIKVDFFTKYNFYEDDKSEIFRNDFSIIKKCADNYESIHKFPKISSLLLTDYLQYDSPKRELLRSGELVQLLEKGVTPQTLYCKDLNSLQIIQRYQASHEKFHDIISKEFHHGILEMSDEGIIAEIIKIYMHA